MSNSSVPWDGAHIGNGPILLAGASEGPDATFLAARLDGEQVHLLAVSRLVEFVQVHSKEVFVGADLVPLGGGAGNQTSEAHPMILACLRELAASSGWIELPLLDRLVRFARRDCDLKLRSLADLAGTSGDNPIERLRVAYLGLRQASVALLDDIALPREPMFRLEGEPTGTMDLPGLGPMAGTPGEGAVPLGVDVEFRAALVFAALQSRLDGGGLRAIPEQLRALEERAEHEYRRASEILSRDPQARECFRWEGGTGVVRRDKRGFVESTDRLKQWLRRAADQLCDAQNLPAPVPRRPDGTPVLNPEHWGVWAGCDLVLWAWRQLSRMAELVRLGQRKDLEVYPRYETLPALRSWEPNLAVYRRFGVRVLEPRPDHVFLAGRVRHLQLRSLAAVAVRRDYVARGQARLLNYLLRTRRPLWVAAKELFVANEVSRARREQLPGQISPDAIDECRRQAEARFLEMRNQRSEEFRRWTYLVQALLDVAPLGLATPLATTLLRLECGLDGLTEPEVIRLIDLLAREVVYELKTFREDRTEDIVGARLGMTSQEVLARFIRTDHPDTSGAAMRNALGGQGRRPRRVQPVPASDPSTPSPDSSRRADLYEYRSLTLGGRPTIRATQCAMRQQEDLLAADEVMLEVAFALIDKGYRLLGLAGSEFVVEVPADRAEQVLGEVRALTSAVATASLKGPSVPVIVRLATAW